MTAKDPTNFPAKTAMSRTLGRVILSLTMFAATAIGLDVNTAQGAMIATTETKVEYAKATLEKVLSPDFELYPGSIQIDERVEKFIDIGGTARALVGRERNELVISFQAIHKSGTHFTGRIYMTISAVAETTQDISQNNNTTIYNRDIATGRMLKVQLFDHENYVKTITHKDLNLKPTEAR